MKFNWFQWVPGKCKQRRCVDAKTSQLILFPIDTIPMYRRLHALPNKIVLLHISLIFPLISPTNASYLCMEKHLTIDRDEQKKEQQKASNEHTTWPTQIQNWFTIAIWCFMHPFANVAVRQSHANSDDEHRFSFSTSLYILRYIFLVSHRTFLCKMVVT